MRVTGFVIKLGLEVWDITIVCALFSHVLKYIHKSIKPTNITFSHIIRNIRIKYISVQIEDNREEEQGRWMGGGEWQYM
jgi:hypothetical protein